MISVYDIIIQKQQKSSEEAAIQALYKDSYSPREKIKPFESEDEYVDGLLSLAPTCTGILRQLIRYQVPGMPFLVSQSKLASWLGVTRETINRCLKVLEERGFILKIDRGYRIGWKCTECRDVRRRACKHKNTCKISLGKIFLSPSFRKKISSIFKQLLLPAALLWGTQVIARKPVFKPESQNVTVILRSIFNIKKQIEEFPQPFNKNWLPEYREARKKATAAKYRTKQLLNESPADEAARLRRLSRPRVVEVPEVMSDESKRKVIASLIEKQCDPELIEHFRKLYNITG